MANIPPNSDINDVLEHAFVTGQKRETFAAIFERYATQGEQALSWPGLQLDIPYGPQQGSQPPHARCVYDLFPHQGKPLGTVLYLHAGYWQSRDKSQFRWIGPVLAALGWQVVIANYPLCPEVSVAQISATTQTILPSYRSRLPESMALPTIVMGHSAGAQLAVEMALDPNLNKTIQAVIAISGVYDLMPLIDTSLNLNLKLDQSSAALASPLIRHIQPCALPFALFGVGAAETPAFVTQTQQMTQRWQTLGGHAQSVIVPQADHFSILDNVRQWIEQVQQPILD